jgi:ELWxxDGT repeat protein
MYKRFLSLLIVTLLFNVQSHAQFNLIKNFDGGALSSFSSYYSGILHSVGSKVLVQYDSISVGAYKNKTILASIDLAGNNQSIASVTTSSDYEVFFDFKTLADGRVAFISNESSSVYTIIITDGTTTGTTTVYSAANPIDGLELIDNGLYFTYDGTSNHSLMKIDLTSLTVSQVTQFGYYGMISDISKVSNTSLIFIAPDATDGNKKKLYVSDGTSVGTTILAVINTGSEVSQNTVMTQVGNNVYFFYKMPGTDCCNNLWVTDGTVNGTKILKEFNILPFTDYAHEKKAIAWNNKFYFSAVPTGGSISSDESLWVSDGTAAGTIRLNDPVNYYKPSNFTVFSNQLYFIAYNNDVYDYSLYKSDGTQVGTSIVSLKYNNSTLHPYTFASDGSYLYLGANTSTYGAELFRYDGINNNGCAISEGVVGSGSSNPQNIFVNGTDLYFTANLDNGNIGAELYTATFSNALPTSNISAQTSLFLIYPNPTKDQITVHSSEKVKSIRLINQLGNMLSETDGNSMNVETYSAGVYFVEVELMNGESGFHKIIITK